MTTSVTEQRYAGRVEEKGEAVRPVTFVQAGLFQFVNVKAVMMAVSCAAAFTLPGEHYALSAVLVGIVFSLVNLPCVSVWAGFGMGIRQFLNSDRSLQMFNCPWPLLQQLQFCCFISNLTEYRMLVISWVND